MSGPWVETADGALLRLDHIAGLYIKQEQAAAPNDNPPAILFAFTPAGAPTVLARGPREDVSKVLDKIKPLLGHIEALQDPSPRDQAGEPQSPGQPGLVVPGQYL